ncbi:hypothetical protein [Streptomyces lannensis]|uniref:Uncharacterized protein n=1 Tax=Streptomyces lannensis TaxID=766498 RepID=A0ABP7KU16_9ACTN
MIRFDFIPREDDPSWDREWQPLNPATRRPVSLQELPGSAFTFECFQVNVVLEIGGANFNLAKKGIPALDFVLMLDNGVKEVGRFGESCVETSISQDVLRFKTREGFVEVSSSFSSDVAKVSIGQLEQLVSGFLERTLELFREAHPQLTRNAYLNSVIQRVGSW